MGGQLNQISSHRVVLALLVLSMCLYRTFSSTPLDYAFTCPAGWTIGYGKCYKFFSEPHTYDDAQKVCSNFGDGHLAIGKDNHKKAAFIRHVVENSHPTSNIWWQGAMLPAHRDPSAPLPVVLVTGEDLDPRVGFFDDCEIEPGPKPYRRCLAMLGNQHSYLHPVVYGSTLRPCKMKLPFVCVQECCPAGHPTYQSTGGMLKCVNGLCVPNFRKCDGVDDCGDKSDERDCNNDPGVNNYLYTGTTSGTFSLQGYGSYEHHQWSIEVDPGHQIVANINNLFIEKDADILEVWCGGRSLAKSALIMRYSGEHAFVGPLKCLSAFMTFVFYSDFNTHQSGFSVNWAATLLPPKQILRADPDSKGLIMLSPILKGSRREWVIKSDNKWLIVTLVRKQLKLPKGAKLSVFDGDTYEHQLLFEYVAGEEDTDDWLSAKYIQSTGQYMSLCLWTPHDGHYGELEFEYLAGCYVELAATHAIIQNAGRYNTSPYPNNMHCTYHVTTNSTLLDDETGQYEFLEIVIKNVNIDPKDTLVVTTAGVEVYNTDNTGPGILPNAIQGSSPSVTIKFWTSGLGNDKGFSIGLSTGCEDLTFTAETITNPAVPTFNQGDTITISCQPGYYLAQQYYSPTTPNTGPINIECLVGGWNTPQKPDCYKQVCGDLPTVANAFIPEQTSTALAGYEFEDIVRYECYAGFAFVDAAVTSVQCISNGAGGVMWGNTGTNQLPVCGGATNCPDLQGTITNGNVQLIYGTTYTELYATLEYTCNEGYVLDGGADDPEDTKYRVCVSGAWLPQTTTATVPTCRRKKCHLPLIANAVPWGTPLDIAYEDTRTVNCETGFMRSGSESIQCQSDQSFTTPPTCDDENECTRLPNPCGEHGNCINTPGSFKCWCDTNFELVGETTCVDKEDCIGTNNIGPCDPVNGACTDDTVNGGYTCSCTTSGYQLYESEGFNGFFNPPNDDANKKNTKFEIGKTCVPRQCPYDHNSEPITGAILLQYKSAYHVNDVVSFLCEAPRVPSITPLRSTCQVDGNWSPPLSGTGSLMCNTGQCQVPTGADANATPVYTDTSGSALAPGSLVDANTIVTLTCSVAPGRPTELTFQRECSWHQTSSTYRFEGDQPFECPFTKCIEPDLAFSIGDGVLTYQGPTSPPLFAGSTYLIVCNSGSAFTGNTGNADNNKLVVCGNNGHWIIGNAYCSAGQCGNPMTIPGATQNTNRYAVGTTVTYNCEQGFELQPTNFNGFTCRASSGTGGPVYDPDPSTLSDLKCVDVTAPVITTCPQNFKVPLNSIVTLPRPTADADNDGGAPVMTPVFDSPNQNFIDKSPLIISPLVVTWEVRGQDPASPAANCSYTVSASDETPPDINVITSFVYYATSTTPVNIENLMSATTISSASENSVTFSPTEFTPVQRSSNAIKVDVTVTGTNSLTNTASFFIIVKDSCTWTDLQAPANGAIDCEGVNTCIATCNEGYKYRKGNNIVLSHTFTCSNNVWQSPDESFTPNGVVPDCSLVEDGVFEQLVTYFWNIARSEPNPAACRDTYVSYFTDQIKTVSSDYQCRNVRTEISSVDDSSVTVDNFKRLMISFTVEMTPDKSVLTEDADITEALNNCSAKIAYYLENENNPHQTINKMPENTNICQFAYLDQASSGATADISTDCPEDSITDGASGCVACAAGSYYDSATGCTGCPKNTISTAGSSQCTPCSTGKGTAGVGWSICEDTCSTIGTKEGVHGVSDTGVHPCTQCAVDMHVSTDNPDTQCQACPGPTGANTAGTGYNSPGASDSSMCIEICTPGSVSTTGLAPCSQCPMGTYMADSRQSSCIPCSDPTQTTSGTGNTAESDCAARTTAHCSGINCNNGDCVIGNNRPVCNCEAGWTGEFCTVNIDECAAPSPCNRGTCTDEVNGYTCSNCPTGFSGNNCEVNNNCNNDRCSDNGKCQTIWADPGWECVCQVNYGGETCATTTDPCPGECTQGTCVSQGFTRYRCECPAGWTGANCDMQIDECLSEPCRNGGTCKDNTDGYVCTCTASWTGTYCQTHQDTCSDGQCIGNECIVDYMTGPSKCRCDKEKNYEREDPLVTAPIPGVQTVGNQCKLVLSCNQPENVGACLNNGQCVNPDDVTGMFTCNNCDPGWEGQRCQISIDDCASNPCQNEGTCVDGHQEYTCLCTPGWTGDNCDEDIDECTVPALTCDEVGTQQEINGLSFCECMCKPGYTGDRCENDYNDCGVDTCLFNGACTDEVNGFSCVCTRDRFGDICDNSPTPCQTNPCQNNGECRPLELCACETGSYGTNCNSVTDICNDVTNYCQNGGTCLTQTETSAHCTCPPDFTGDRCDVKVNACENDMCKNGGTCISSLDDFKCSCGIGYSGPTCEIGPDLCTADYCGNNGECINSPFHGRLCCCEPGYGGQKCEKPIDRDFDLHCDGYKDGKSIVYQMNPFKLRSNSFTIAVWVRYKPDTTDDGIDDATGVFASMYRADEPFNNPTDPFEKKHIVLTMDESKVIVYLPGAGSPQVYYYRQPNNEVYEIDDGQWYRAVVTCNGTTGLFTVYVNTVRVAQQVLPKTNHFEYAWLSLGSGFNNIDGTYFDSFEGSLSQVLVWDRELTSGDIIEITKPPVSPNPQVPITNGLVMDDARWVLHPGCWLKSPTKAGKPYIPLPPEQPKPKFLNCPEGPITVIGTERRTVVEWPELEAKNSATSIWCRFNSGRGFTWGLYTNVCIIKNAQGFTDTCKFDIVVRKLNCPDMIIYDGELPPTCEYLSEYGGVRTCKYECPDPANRVISVAQPQSYMCDKLGSFNPRYIYNEGRLPACGVETEYEVLYDLVIQVSYPNVSLCSAVMEVGGISEELRVRIKNINDRSTSVNADGSLNNSPLCQEADCSDVVMTVDCPGTHITMEFHYTPSGITYGSTAGVVSYNNAVDLLQEVLIDYKLLDSDRVHEGLADPKSLCFDKFPVCRPGHGYLKGLCVVCAKGQYAPSKNEPCRMCPVGYYQDSPASSTCTKCPDGKMTEYWGAVSASECISICKAGEYYNIDFRKCKLCPLGTYSDKPGMTRCCEPCQAYQTTYSVGASSKYHCVDTCPDGHMLAHGDRCEPCEKGTYRQRDLQDDCQPCPIGYTTEEQASKSIEDCSVPDCSYGSYMNGSVCLPCPKGYYQPFSSQMSCIKCPLDQTTLNMGSTKQGQCIYACPAGAEPVDNKKCKPCERGFYRESDLPDTFCKPCPKGYITQTTGATSISKCIVAACEPGEFLNTNENLCKPCPEDTYQSEYWQTFCKDCATGTSTGSLIGSDSESDCKRYCPAGQEDQGGVCLPCPLGTWKDTGSHAPCRHCPKGLYTAGTGSTSENQCDREHCYPGQYLTPELVCAECERGYYQPMFQQTRCLPCRHGRTTDDAATDCIADCSSGQGWDSRVERCLLCPKGTYRTQGIEDDCTDCPLGYTTPTEGSYTAADCSQESPSDLAILIGAPIGGVLFILLICIGLFACGCCSCKHMGRPYHRYSNKSSPTPSIHSSTYAVAPPAQTLFQHPITRYAAQPMNQQPYNPTTPVVTTNGNGTTVIRIQTSAPAPRQHNAGMSIDYGYSNPNLSSGFKFFEDRPTNKVYNNNRDPTVATMNFA